MSNLKDLITEVSAAQNVPAGKVRKIYLALVKNLEASLDSGEKFRLPGLTFRPKTIEAKVASYESPERPEQKIFIVRKSNKAA